MTNTSTHPSVKVCEHPLLQHNLSILRNKTSNSEEFRHAARRVGQFILQEATRELPVVNSIIETPICHTQTKVLSPDIPIIITPILRAGLIMSDVMIDLIPTARVYHIGCYRDEHTLKPVTYYNKLPAEMDYAHARFFLLDPMLATGGTILSALKIITDLGAIETNITFSSIISSPEGIKALTDIYSRIKIFTGAIDEKLNDDSYIVPGLGDAGDRSFGTN